MNERIKELAEQAQQWADEHDDPWCNPEPGLDVIALFNQKLAELIIRDCISCIRKDENGPAYEAVGRIADHFGLE